MQVKQWEDKNLSHFSYGVLSDCEKEMVLIDPSRNPAPYLQFAKEQGAKIIGIIETHPHADFVSGHLELHQLTGAPIYVHSLLGAFYNHVPFDEGASISFGKLKLTSIHTPGHSPDSICILLEKEGVQKAVFTGDTLFIGDCGRPDLREGAGKIQANRTILAKQMYHSLRQKLMVLNDDVLVYPAHGAGTLCGRNLSKESSSTIGAEKGYNWSLAEATEDEFVANLLTDQPFVPLYFGYDVELNRKGAPPFAESIAKVPVHQSPINNIESNVWIVDARSEKAFKKGHLPQAANIMEAGKFETWLGAIIKPNEPFYIAGESTEQLQRLLARAAAIGYEAGVKGAFIVDEGDENEQAFDLTKFKKNKEAYTIVDVRNTTEVKSGSFFEDAISIPLPEIRWRLSELPVNKPIVVHCAAGYRSAAASSIIESFVSGAVPVYDMGEAVKEFSN